jgi:hypothetical protein
MYVFEHSNCEGVNGGYFSKSRFRRSKILKKDFSISDLTAVVLIWIVLGSFCVYK